MFKFKRPNFKKESKMVGDVSRIENCSDVETDILVSSISKVVGILSLVEISISISCWSNLFFPVRNIFYVW